jgi:hypothetical protein
MKLRVALIATALFASAVALAGPHGGPGPDMDRMAILLDLNDSQKAEVQKILSEQHDKVTRRSAPPARSRHTKSVRNFTRS